MEKQRCPDWCDTESKRYREVTVNKAKQALYSFVGNRSHKPL